MPAYKDLETIKKKIKKFGNEEEILKKNKTLYNDTPLPSKEQTKTKSNENIQDSQNPPEGFSLDIDSAIDSIEENKHDEEIQMPFETLENLDIDGSIDNIQDISDKDILSSDVREEPFSVIEDNKEDSFSVEDPSLDSLSGDLTAEDIDIPSMPEEAKDNKIIEEEIESQDDINALLGGFDSESPEDAKIDETGLDSLLGGLGEETKEESTGKFDDLDSLLGDMPSEKTDSSGTDDFLKNMETEEPSDFLQTGIDDGLKDLAGQFDQEPEEHKEESIDFTKEPGDDLSGFDDLSGLLGENKIEEGQPSEEISSDMSFEGMDEGIKEESVSEPSSDESFDLSDISGENKKQEPALDLGLEDMDELSIPSQETGESEMNLQDFSGFEEKPLEEKSEGFLDFDSLSLDKLSEIGDDLGTSQIEGKEEDQFNISEIKISDTTAGAGKMPEELSHEDLSKDKDVEINLSDDQRKQIIITLTTLPKDAEIRITRAIISNKYSNRQLKPLINALLSGDLPQVIIKLYEKITTDKSLFKISGAKHTGAEFEERQKSLSYLLQKNLMPIIAAISVFAVLFLSGLLLFINVLLPTWDASKYYNLGKKNIKEKVFWEAEGNFKTAFEIQPRYKEVVEYARLYKKDKRYNEAEKKYELASNMKPLDDSLTMEYADFYRIKGDYERSEKKYKNLLKVNEKNIPAMLGLAQNYYDWSNDDYTKLEDAWQTYLDVLGIDKKNKEAVYGKLYIAIKQKNHKEIIKHYDYIEKVFGKTVNPVAYTELAKYLIDINELDNVKNILEKANKSKKGKQILPEIDYQYARYNKILNIRDIEKKYLERSLNQFDSLKNTDPEQYNSQRYQKILSRVYNDLGENYDLKEKASIKAEEYYLKSINADPEFGMAYYNLANFSLKNKPSGYDEAKQLYIEAEQKGYKNDNLNFNLGWIYCREKDYVNAMQRIAMLLDVHKDNTNLKFMIGTIYYNIGNYDLAESWLLETYLHYNDLAQQYYPLEIEEEEDKMIMEMIKKTANNLGAVYQKKYEKTRKTKFLIEATKYYSDSIMYLNRLVTQMDMADASRIKELSNINIRMVLYPYAGEESPFVYEDFPLDYTTTM